jgi:hypothetical protein
MVETLELNDAELISVSEEPKRKVLTFVTADNREHKISDFKNGEASRDAVVGENYTVLYVETQKEGYKFAFKNLKGMMTTTGSPNKTAKGENIRDEPIGRSAAPAPSRAAVRDEYFANKDIVIAKQSCLRDACMIAEIQATLKQVTKVDLPYIYILANDLLKQIYPEAKGFN